MRIFIAGATGAIGRRLVPMLVEGGHEVTGMTRTPAKAEGLRAQGAEAGQEGDRFVAQPVGAAT